VQYDSGQRRSPLFQHLIADELRSGPACQAAPRCDYREDFDEINDETG
jgi:hypothetical protein